jgi:hypothetical protein
MPGPFPAPEMAFQRTLRTVHFAPSTANQLCVYLCTYLFVHFLAIPTEGRNLLSRPAAEKPVPRQKTRRSE